MDTSITSKSSLLGMSSSTLYGRRKLKEDAEADLFQQLTEADAMEHLWRTKPTYLCRDGSDVWTDQKDIEKKISEIILKLKINSFTDRAKRLEYLQSVLKQKWANKPETYKGMMTFLIEMSGRPTKNVNLQLRDTEYSNSIEEDTGESTLFGEELQRAKLKEEEFRREIVEDLLQVRTEAVHYSSEEELSDWSLLTDEEEEIEVKSMASSTPVLSSTNSSDKYVDSAETERKRKELSSKFWHSQRNEAENYLKSHIRHVEPSPLIDQPVISSLVALYTRFGEHWEWKKASAAHQRPKSLLVSESDIIRELIWQFISPSPHDSPIFSVDWTLRPEIIVKTLSHSCLISFMQTYGELFSKLQRMREFTRNCSVVETYPQMFRCYAHALSKTLLFVTQKLNEVERWLKTETNPETRVGVDRPPSTLIQFNKTLQPVIRLIISLDHLHSQAICLEELIPNWLKSLRLISCLESHLNQVTHIPLYGLVLFIFSKCFESSLDLILKPLELQEWNSEEFLFIKSAHKISQSTFWNESITVHPIEVEFKKLNLKPLSILDSVVPKVLTMLKVHELKNQLGNEMGCSSQDVMYRSLPSYKDIVTQFLDELLNRSSDVEMNEGLGIPKITASSGRRSDLNVHLQYLGLQNSIISDAFRSLLDGVENSNERSRKSKDEPRYADIEEFYNIKCIPVVQMSHYLGKVLEEKLNPYFEYGEASLTDIFKRYAVSDALRLLREIIFTAREDFSTACIELAKAHRKSEAETHEIKETPNAGFQNILDSYYPENRSTFELEFLHDSRSGNFCLKIRPQFPLTLLLTRATIRHYEYVSHAIFRIRKCLQMLNKLIPGECVPAIGVELHRMLLIRFSMIHFWSSLRSFVLITTFGSDESQFSYDDCSAMELLRFYEEEPGARTLYKLLCFRLVETYVMKSMTRETVLLSTGWKRRLPLVQLIQLGVRVRRTWKYFLDAGASNYASKADEMIQFFAPIPEGIF